MKIVQKPPFFSLLRSFEIGLPRKSSSTRWEADISTGVRPTSGEFVKQTTDCIWRNRWVHNDTQTTSTEALAVRPLVIRASIMWCKQEETDVTPDHITVSDIFYFPFSMLSTEFFTQTHLRAESIMNFISYSNCSQTQSFNNISPNNKSLSESSPTVALMERYCHWITWTRTALYFFCEGWVA